MRAIARAHQDRNLGDFEKALRDYRVGECCSANVPFIPLLTIVIELSSDPTIRSHLAALYDTLLEQNLLRIVEPYSVVEVEYISQCVGQGRQAVEAKWVSSFSPLSSFYASKPDHSNPPADFHR